MLDLPSADNIFGTISVLSGITYLFPKLYKLSMLTVKKKKKKKKEARSSRCGSVETNLTSIRED